MRGLKAFIDSEWGRVFISGSGFLADGYDLYVIGGVEHVLAEQYACSHTTRVDCLEDSEFQAFKSMTSSAALFGAIVGQLLFGALADRLGRRVIFVITGFLIITGSILSAMVQEFGMGPQCLLGQLVVCRGLLGFGIGGEYPLSATICAEGTAARRRGTLMALVFSHQGLGYLLSALVMVALTFSGQSLEFTWRFALAFGAVVPIATLYFRMQMHESGDFEKVKRAREDGHAHVDIKSTIRRYAWHLLGTAGNWFLFDIVFYANSLFNGDITSIIDLGYEGLQETSLKTLTIVLIMLPGYYVGVALINRVGRKNVQIFGYANMILWFGVVGLAYEWLRAEAPMLFLTIYGLTFFFSNFGPNLSTYVIPGEIFPSQAKATLHGLSAAAGKAGAFFGACVMPYASGTPPTDAGIERVMFLCALIALMGLVLTIFLTPRYGPEDLAPKEAGETVGFVPLFCQPQTAVSTSSRAVEGAKVAAPSDASTEDIGCSKTQEISGIVFEAKTSGDGAASPVVLHL